MNSVSSLEKKEKNTVQLQINHGSFSCWKKKKALKGLFLSPESSFLEVILVPEELVSSLIYRIDSI